MKILILTGRFGMGHYSTAVSLKEEIESEMRSSTVEVVDILSFLTPKLDNIIYSSFNLLVEKASGIYNIFYNNLDSLQLDLDVNIWQLFYSKLDRLVRDEGVDIIISTLPLSSGIMSDYKEKRNLNIPLITYITDISVHSEWLNKGTDLYMVPTESVKENLKKCNIREDRIIVRGIPVKNQFKQECKKTHRENRKKILIMGGGLGLIPIKDSEFRRLNMDISLDVTIITGKNKKIYNRLKDKYKNINVVGYTDRVWEYMKNADLIVSKSGGITLFESIYSELPLLILSPFLAQEKNNAVFIERENIGQVIWDKNEDVYLRLKEMIKDEVKMEYMKKNLIRIKNSKDEEPILSILKELGEEVRVS